MKASFYLLSLLLLTNEVLQVDTVRQQDLASTFDRLTESLDLHHLLVVGEELGVDGTVEQVVDWSLFSRLLLKLDLLLSVEDGVCAVLLLNWHVQRLLAEQELSSQVSWVLANLLQTLLQSLLALGGIGEQTWHARHFAHILIPVGLVAFLINQL